MNEKEEIKNDKLTPDMNLTRSGSIMLFRKDYGDRRFTSEENADVVIEALRPELVAKLIENKWYWINDCPKCNGKPANYAYAVCEKHNVCVTCGINRKDIKETPWGHKNGFRCKPCQTVISENIRVAALEKVAEEEYCESDYEYTDELICPHCGTKQYHEMPDGEPSHQNECETCGGKFTAEIEYSYTFSTSVIGERIKL